MEDDPIHAKYIRQKIALAMERARSLRKRRIFWIETKDGIEYRFRGDGKYEPFDIWILDQKKGDWNMFSPRSWIPK